MTEPTPSQQEAYDACMAVAKVLQAGLNPTDRQMERIRNALIQLRLEPQPPGLMEALEEGLRVFLGPWWRA